MDLAPVLHGAFSLTRTFAAPPARVFAAFSEAEQRLRWFRLPGRVESHALDFREGGHEAARAHFTHPERSEVVEYRARFLEIVPGARILWSSEVLLDGVRRAASLVTLELDSDPSGTRVRYTEQYAVLVPSGDGQDDVGEKRGGAGLMLTRLQVFLEQG